MSHEVIITRRAKRAIEERYDQMADRSLDSAERWRRMVLAGVHSLADNPLGCGEAPEAELHGRDIRQLVVGRRRNQYRILFEMDGDAVSVLQVRHGRQDYWRPGGS